MLPTIAHLVGRTGALTHYLEPDVIVPVPLHVSRLRERQFNQSLLLSRACFKKWRAKIKTNLLIRRYNTTPQSLLSGNERRQNLKGCFELTDNSSLAGKKILLVDDVLTTGSTINECVKVLRRSQPERIEVLVIARSLTNFFN